MLPQHAELRVQKDRSTNTSIQPKLNRLEPLLPVLPNRSHSKSKTENEEILVSIISLKNLNLTSDWQWQLRVEAFNIWKLRLFKPWGFDVAVSVWEWEQTILEKGGLETQQKLFSGVGSEISVFDVLEGERLEGFLSRFRIWSDFIFYFKS
jgi:hypothetical protein